MNEVTQNAKGRVRIYAAGGASINIMGMIGALNINPDLLSDFDIVQIDTSNSNMTGRSTSVENYLLPKLVNVDGGGKDRTANEALIAEHVKPILKKHPPRDGNIVISTGSGSSGSTIATKLVNELLARGEKVIVLLIGTTGSRKEALNTLETRKNYEQIAKARQKPVIVHYMQNSEAMPREKVNSQMLSTISYLGMLFSRRNAGLDTMDLANLLNFTRPEVTKGGLPNQMYSMTVLVRENTEPGEALFVEDLKQLGNVLAAATLTRPGGVTELPSEFMPEYHTEGFVAESKDSKVFEGRSVNFLISDGLLEAQNESLREFAKRDKPQVARPTLLDDNDEDDDTAVNF